MVLVVLWVSFNFISAFLVSSKILNFQGRFLDAGANVLFLLILILIAKGYTVTRSTLRTITVIKLVIVFCFYSVAYIIAFVYSEAVNNFYLEIINSNKFYFILAL